MSINSVENNSNLYKNLLESPFFSPFLIQSLINTKKSLVEQSSSNETKFPLTTNAIFDYESQSSDDEFNVEHENKRKRTRTNFTSSQIDQLEKAFQTSSFFFNLLDASTCLFFLQVTIPMFTCEKL